MPTPEEITAWATVLLVFATAIGFGFVAWQAAELRTTITDDALNTLYKQYTEMLSLLYTKPELYPYVYSNAVLSDPALRAEMNLICEALLALIEHALMYDRRLPHDAGIIAGNLLP